MQAHGLACVVSDTGGLAELADHGRAARLVPPGDVAALARELAALMDDAEARRALAAKRAVRTRALSQWPAYAERTERFYRAALAR